MAVVLEGPFDRQAELLVADVCELARLLRATLDAADAGRIEVHSALEQRFLRRLEGALAAYEVASRIAVQD